MIIANVLEAKTQLSKLLEAVERGEEVIIARAGKPVARLVAAEAARAPRPHGVWRDQIWLAPDWEDNGEIQAAFEAARTRPFE